MTYTNKNMHEVTDGDIVKMHGCIFRLKNGRKSESHTELDSAVMIFDTDFIRQEDASNMPEAWRSNWKVQGNEHRFVATQNA